MGRVGCCERGRSRAECLPRRAFVEISPHPVLAFGATETFEEALEDPSEAVLLASLKREADEPLAWDDKVWVTFPADAGIVLKN